MHDKLNRFLNYSSGSIFLALASALFVASWASEGLTSPQEPVFAMPIRQFFWIVGGLALGVALVCLFGRQLWLQTSLVFWLAMNLAVYHWALVSSGAGTGLKGYLGPVASAFGILPGTANMLMKSAVLFPLVGSALALLSLAGRKLAGRLSSGQTKYWKIACPYCAGRIAFPVEGVGTQVPCPHCATSVTLQQP